MHDPGLSMNKLSDRRDVASFCSSLAPTAMSTMVDPALLNAFHKPNAVPIQAWEGTNSGTEAMNGI
jgi:hypothetical protein